MNKMWPILFLMESGCLEAVPASPPSCAECHGTPGNPAPPVGLGGEDDGPAVGAHTAHQTPDLAVPVACTECHVVPAATGSPGHIDSALPAEVVWGPLAGQGPGESPYDPGTQTCTVYCHGANFAGGAVDLPGWNDGPSVTACDSCHGFPPPPPHPADSTCGNCHPTPGNGTHIDGTVDFLGAR